MNLFRRRRRETALPQPIRQDSTADSHRLLPGGSPADTEAWLARRGASWEPASDVVADGLLIHQAEGPDLNADWGDTLTWDGQYITIDP